MFPSSPPQVIFPTSDLISTFSQAINVQIDHRDALELLHQLFDILTSSNPIDMYDRQILDLSRFRFLTAYPSMDAIPAEFQALIHKAAYAVLVQLQIRMDDTGKLGNLSYKDYLPYIMIGNDVCLKQYQN